MPPAGATRLIWQLETAWSDFAGISDRLLSASRELRRVHEKPLDLAASRDLYEQEARLLLIGPVEEFGRARPIRRSLEAMQEFDRQASTATVKARAPIDSEFQNLLDSAGIALCEAWRIQQSAGTAKEWQDWETQVAKHASRGRDLLARYQKWSTTAIGDKGEIKRDDNQQKKANLWWRRETAVEALQNIEGAFVKLRIAWLNSACDVVQSLLLERRQNLALADKMIEWIRSGADATSPAPADSMLLATCDERLRGWRNQIEAESADCLLEHTELNAVELRNSFRDVHARAAFLSTFAAFCQPAMQQAIADYWEGTACIVREASRAKEIVDHWRAESSDSPDLFDQARNNASSILAEQIAASSSSTALEAKLAQAFWNWIEEGSTILEAAETGWMALLLKPRGRRLSRTLMRESRSRAVTMSHRVGRWGADKCERALELFGGKLPTTAAASPVVRRTTLRDTLSLPASKSELPRIYGSLFKLAPIEDRRFLIGRDRELIGLEQALSDWDSGRFAACIFVGARGSGKTSLLNCAADGAFAGREVIRTQFHERAVTAEAVDGFLREVLAISSVADLDEELSAKRRILMIEEGERIFLRKIGGFAGAHRLMHWIQRTGSTTLWVLAMNDRAFQVLSAAAQFSRVFSHRINAMSVSKADLESALLERHRLSGLRLEFAPPPAGDPRISRAKALFGLDASPQRLFFDSLYQQSAGVFRSAFELWLSSIERVEGETLKIRQPLEPAFASLRGELQQIDLFTLLMIQEHGSLEHSEMAEVLCEDREASRARMDRLVALGLLDKDPEHLGFRVRPEAHRFVNSVLRRVNLIEELE